MNISFDESTLKFDKIEYQIGEAATEFTSVSHTTYERVSGEIKNMFLDFYYMKAPYEIIFSELNEYVRELEFNNPYFNFYIDTYISYLMAHYGFGQRDLVLKITDSFLIDGSNRLRFYETEDPKWHIESGHANFYLDYVARQARLQEDFAAITSSTEDLKEFSQLQRLYILSLQGRNYLTGKFQTSLMPDHFPMPKGIKKIKSALLKNEVDIVEMVNIETINDLFGYELYHTLKTGLTIRKCKYCYHYFIVRGRSDTEYCNRILTGETKPCSIIGATRNYWDGKKDDPIHNEFQKAYKRNHSRRRVGTMSESDFFTWSEEARAKCKECEVGEMTLEEYKLWLGNKR